MVDRTNLSVPPTLQDPVVLLKLLEQMTGQFSTSLTTDVLLNTKDRHVHSNKAVLDLISAAGSGQVITSAERTLLKHFLGSFTSLSALVTAHSSGTNGDYAIVQGSSVTLYLWDTTNSKWYTPTLAARVARCYLSADLTVPAATNTQIPFDVADFDTDTILDLGAHPGRVAPKRAGYYKITLATKAPAAATGATAYLYKNGALYQTGESNVSNSLTTARCSVVTYFNGTTDYLEGYINLVSASTATSGISNTVLNVEYLGS